MIDYAYIAIDDAGKATIERIEPKLRRQRVAEEVILPAATVQAELPYVHSDGRKGTLKGTVALPARIEPAEVKRGRDGKPEARPVEDAEKPTPHPWQRLSQPHHEIHPDSVTRYWLAEDRDLEDVRAARAAEIRAAAKETLFDVIIAGGDVAAARAAIAADLEAVAKASTPRQAWQAGRGRAGDAEATAPLAER